MQKYLELEKVASATLEQALHVGFHDIAEGSVVGQIYRNDLDVELAHFIA